MSLASPLDRGKPASAAAGSSAMASHLGRLYRRREGDWWGLVFQTDELFAERDRASRDREMIAQNARTYERRRALEAMP